MKRFADVLSIGLSKWNVERQLLKPEALLGRSMESTAYGWRKWIGYLDKFILFPAILRRKTRELSVARQRGRCLVHICDHSNAVYANHTTGVPVVVTCHDLLAVRGAMGERTNCPASRTGVVLQRWILSGLKRADAIVSVSSATRSDVLRLVPGAEKKLTPVVLNALNYPYRVLSPSEAGDRLFPIKGLKPKTPYILHVGSNALRKNRPALLRIIALLKSQWNGVLVLAGEPLSVDLRELALGLGVLDKIVEVRKPADAVLEALYNRASVMVFPSTHEGFGWPLIEAQACGCPVICSDAGPFEEVVGDSAWRIRVEDEAAYAAAVLKLQEPAIRQEWVSRGIENAKRFEPRFMIDGYRAVYAEVMERYVSGSLR
jgi:glycosyltransferase involved in cell wall biosynthesis